MSSGLLFLLALLLANAASRGSPPDITAPAKQALRRSRWCHRGSNIEEEHGLTSGFGRGRVEIDHISNLLFLAVDVARDEPVVAIKGRFGAGSMTVSHFNMEL